MIPFCPDTPAIRQLRAAGVPFAPYFYPYVEKGGTAATAAALMLDEHQIIKTLVFQDENARPCIVLMHGDRRVNTRAVAAALGVRRLKACAPDVAQAHTGYLVGGSSPFGLPGSLPVCLEGTIARLPRIYLNGGQRGFLIALDPGDLLRVLRPRLVAAAL